MNSLFKTSFFVFKSKKGIPVGENVLGACKFLERKMGNKDKKRKSRSSLNMR